MTQLPIVFHPDAFEEAEASLVWYAERSRRAADRFLEALETAVDAIAGSPNRWPRFEGEVRRVILRKYPYLVFYRVLPERIEIIAVAHGRRRPGYWRRRLDQ